MIKFNFIQIYVLVYSFILISTISLIISNPTKNSMEIRVNIKKVSNQATLPSYATSGSAGADLFSNSEEEVTLKPGQKHKFPTGVALEIPEDWYVAVVARSGLSTKYGISLTNSIGIIDSDYRGEIFVSLINNGTREYTIAPGDSIAQMMLQPSITMLFKEVKHLSSTSRGEGGFGSTGR